MHNRRILAVLAIVCTIALKHIVAQPLVAAPVAEEHRAKLPTTKPVPEKTATKSSLPATKLGTQLESADKCYEERDFRGAIKHYDAACVELERQIAAYPKFVDARIMLGRTYLRSAGAAELDNNLVEAKRRNLESKRHLEIAVSECCDPLQPKSNLNTEAKLLLAEVDLELGNPKDALTVLTTINTLDLKRELELRLLRCTMRAYEQLSEETKAAEIEAKLEELGGGNNWNKWAKPKFPAEINRTRTRLPANLPPEIDRTRYVRPSKFTGIEDAPGNSKR